jgi:phosphoribosylanthranilate isomerase
VPPPIATFLLTCLQDVDEIVAQYRRCPTTTLQLVDRLSSGSHRRLRAALPAVSIVQVIHVGGEEAVDEALALGTDADAILLDSGNQTLPVKELGGTGRTHDWRLSRRIRESAAVPVFLAGGLRPDNVAEGIRRVRPFGVDLCSGVRTHGKLDADKLRRFFAGVASASATAGLAGLHAEGLVARPPSSRLSTPASRRRS